MRRGILEAGFRFQHEPEEGEFFNFRNAVRKKLPTSRRTPTAKAASPSRASKKGPICRGPHGPKPPLATTPRTAAAIPPRAHQSPILVILDTPYDPWELPEGLQSGRNLLPCCTLTLLTILVNRPGFASMGKPKIQASCDESQDARQPSPRTALPPRMSLGPDWPSVHVTLVTFSRC